MLTIFFEESHKHDIIPSYSDAKEKIEYKKHNNYDYQTKKQPQITIKKLEK